MHYDIHGLTSPNAPTILLSSGLGGSGGYWAPQIPALSERFRVITYDLTGCGGSDLAAYDRARYASLHGHADDLLEIVEEFATGPVVVVGHSVSASIGLLASIARPELFERLVLLGIKLAKGQ